MSILYQSSSYRELRLSRTFVKLNHFLRFPGGSSYREFTVGSRVTEKLSTSSYKQTENICTSIEQDET